MFSISYTTRKPRGHEVDGQNYHFVSREEFEAMIARDEFLEWAEVFGNYYGTHRGILEEARACRERPGTRHRCPRCETIESDRFRRLLLSLSWLPRARFWNRGCARASEDRDEVIERRLREAAEEIRKYEDYDYVLINRDLDGVRRHFERHCSRRAGPADQDRRSDPADSGDISSLKRYRQHG